jgi:hypothetical protein
MRQSFSSLKECQNKGDPMIKVKDFHHLALSLGLPETVPALSVNESEFQFRDLEKEGPNS